MRISIIVAVARNGVIGKDGALPWHLPDDLKRFKALTMGKPVIMGRRTHESIGRPLPGRVNIVLSGRAGFGASGCAVVASPEDALRAARGAEEVMIIGGEAVYRAFLPAAERIYLTEVRGDVEGDARFPAWDRDAWREVSREEHAADGRHGIPFTFVVLERRAAVG